MPPKCPYANAHVRVALSRAAERHLKKHVPANVAGPSNIGNYLAELGIDATAGLGVWYKDLHGAKERIELATVSIREACSNRGAPGVDGVSIEGTGRSRGASLLSHRALRASEGVREAN